MDFLLILYVLFNRDVQYAARTGAVVWVSYSWLMAGKVIVLYLKVMPNIHLSGQSEQEENAFPYVMITPTVIRTTLFGNAVVYSFLMFRASKAVFGSLSKVSLSKVRSQKESMSDSMSLNLKEELSNVVRNFNLSR